jgi:hypothetical protein
LEEQGICRSCARFLVESPFLALQVELMKPEVCDKEVWELMEECWNRDEHLRPTFAEINLFLRRKSFNYDGSETKMET